MRRRLRRKQVAYLLGHKAINQVYRFERNLRMPSLSTAIKLELIYGIPVKWLFTDLTLRLRHQLQDQIASSSYLRKHHTELATDLLVFSEFCAFGEKLRQGRLTALEREIIREHLVLLTKKLGSIK